MSVKVFASVNPAALHLYKGYPDASRNGDAWEVTYKYWCGQNAALGLVPVNGAACPLSGFTDLKCRVANVKGNDRPGFVDITLTYRADESNIGFGDHAAGDIVKSAVLSQEEVAIDDTRIVGSSLLSQSAVDALKAAGVKSIPVGSVEYTYTEYVDSFVWQESNIVAAAGTVQAPTGMTSPTTGRWMAIGATIRQTNGGLTEVSTTWKYNRLGWTA
jgi:hypothetical protein